MTTPNASGLWWGTDANGRQLYRVEQVEGGSFAIRLANADPKEKFVTLNGKRWLDWTEAADDEKAAQP